MTTPYGTPVSPEIERALDSLTGLDDHPPAATVGDYPQFTWFNGGYYGKYGESGRWYLQYCNRYRPSARKADASCPAIGTQSRHFPASERLASGVVG